MNPLNAYLAQSVLAGSRTRAPRTITASHRERAGRLRPVV